VRHLHPEQRCAAVAVDRVGERGRVDVEGAAGCEGVVDQLVELAQRVTGLGGPAPLVGVGKVGDGDLTVTAPGA
jgi:hypothetical protein